MATPRTLLLLAALWAGAPVHAQTRPVRMGGTMEHASEVRALLVLVRFADDPVSDLERFVPGWPAADRAALPPFATTLLASDRGDLATHDSSVSRYFYDQSRLTPDEPGQQLVTGTVMPQDAAGRPYVYVTRHPNAWYHRTAGRGYGYLTQEVLEALLARPGFDAADYDADSDGELDELWLIIRSDEAQRSRGGRVTYSGCANLYGCEAPLTGYPGVQVDSLTTPPPFTIPSPSRGTVRVDWARSGLHAFAATPANLSAQHYFVPLLAHEWGHHLWSDSHLQAVSGRGIPGHESPARTGYALMIGAPDPRTEGALTMSVVERALMGWVTVEPLGGPARTVTVPDLYTGAKAFALDLPNGRLYVSNHQRVGFFDRLRAHPHNQALTGLLAPGLRVTYSAGGLAESVLAPDNALEQGAVYVGGPNPHLTDVYGPGTQTQLTPWTRPSSEGSFLPLGFARSWAALDSIRYTGRADGEMALDYVEDFRARPIVRAASWITSAFAGTALAGPLVVRDAARLDLDVGPGGRFFFERGLTVHGGSAADIGGAGQILTFGRAATVLPGARLHVRAGTTLRLREARLREAFAAPGIDLGPGVRFTLAADDPLEAAVYPSPARDTATLRLELPDAADVRAEVFDVLGRRVALLADAPYSAGGQALAVNLRDLPAGRYLWRVTAGARVRTGTFTRLR